MIKLILSLLVLTSSIASAGPSPFIYGSAGPKSLQPLTAGVCSANATSELVCGGTVTVPGATANTFAGFNGSGNLYTVPGFYINTTSGGMDIGLDEHPNNGGGFTASSANYNFIPLQNSPTENWNIHSIQAFLDPTSTGFSMGSSGNSFSQLLALGYTHHGTSNTGNLSYVSMNNDLGNGTDPITINGLNYSSAGANIHSGVTIDGQINGYGFNPTMQVGSVSGATQNLQAFWDGSQIGVAENTHSSFVAQPNILSINNNSNYTGLMVSPNITTMTGNAGVSGITFGPNITTTNTGGVNGVFVNPIITTMGATSYYHGLDVYGLITTSHGNIQPINVSPQINGGDANLVLATLGANGTATLPSVTGMQINLSGMASSAQKMGLDIQDGKLQVNSLYHTDTLPASPGFVNLIGLSSEYWIKPGFPVTGTLVLADANQENAIFEDDMGPDGFGGFLGYSAKPVLAQTTAAVGKTVSAFNIMPVGASIPDVSGFGITDGGTYTDATIINNLGFIPGGGTVAVTNLYGYRTFSTFGTFATNAWNLYDESSAENHLNKLSINTTTKKVNSGEAVTIVGSVSQGDGTTRATGLYSTALGQSTNVGVTGLSSGNRSLTSGLNNIASGSQSQAFGNTTVASGTGSYAEGFQVQATNTNSHAEGRSTSAGVTGISTGVASHSEGLNTKAMADQAHSEGTTTTASATSAHSEGNNTTASGTSSHAEGINSSATASNAHAEGNTTTASGNQSHSEGNLTVASNSHAHAEGNTTTASGVASHSQGFQTTASGQNAHAEGRSTSAGTLGVSSGTASHSEGLDTVASGNNSHASGKNTQAAADNQTAIGLYNIAVGTPGSPAATDQIFTIGNGTAIGSEATAFYVQRNGYAYANWGVALSTAGTQPTCSATYRGLLWNIEGGAGVADILQICQKDAADVYGWVTK